MTYDQKFLASIGVCALEEYEEPVVGVELLDEKQVQKLVQFMKAQMAKEGL